MANVKLQKGFSLVEIVIVVVIMGLVATIGWLLWQNQKSADKIQESTQATETNNHDASHTFLSLDYSKLPANWSSETDESHIVLLRNQTTDCFSEVFVSKPIESYAEDVDQNKQTLKAVREKGYTVDELPDRELPITTPSGHKPVMAHTWQLSGVGNPSFQHYVHLHEGGYYSKITLSCANEADIAGAKDALLAVTIDLR